MSILQFSYKKCQVLIIWIMFVAFAEILVYTLLFNELESKPRKGLSSKLKMIKLHNALVNELEKEIAHESPHQIILNRIATKSFVDTDDATRSKIYISRKLEKFKSLKEIQPMLSKSDNNPLIAKLKRKTEGKNSKINLNPSVDVVDFNAKTSDKDILISVKTTKQYHNTRLEEIRKTWWTLANSETFFFTDGEDPKANRKFDGHLIDTHCMPGHQRSALCCKMQYELNYFMTKIHNKRWFCHFDDDNYVVYPSLIKLLRQYNHSEPVYLGKPSLERKMQTWDKQKNYQEVHFWFATGGAGFCLSQKLVSLMKPYFSDNTFVKNCERIGLPDDCTIGFISEHLLGVRLTMVDTFHSHLELLEGIPQHTLHEQVSLSHGYVGEHYNHIKIPGRFNEQEDPSRFKSLHCHLYPQTTWCK